MAAPAGYRHLARPLDDADLFTTADLVREAMATPGWKFVEASIAEHRQKMLDQLLNETTKPDDTLRLKGLVKGLLSMEEAAQSILDLAEEREAAANQRLEHTNA